MRLETRTCTRCCWPYNGLGAPAGAERGSRGPASDGEGVRGGEAPRISRVVSRQFPSRMAKQSIASPDAPRAIGPYSSAVRAGQLLFVSGQVPFDPATGAMVGGDIAVQTRRVLDNIGALLKAGGLSFADVVRTTVFLADMNDFAGDERRLRGPISPSRTPARSTVQVARLPRDARIEIDAIAVYETESLVVSLRYAHRSV